MAIYPKKQDENVIDNVSDTLWRVFIALKINTILFGMFYNIKSAISAFW